MVWPQSKWLCLPLTALSKKGIFFFFLIHPNFPGWAACSFCACCSSCFWNESHGSLWIQIWHNKSSKQGMPLYHPLAWQGTYVGRSHRLFNIPQLLRKETAIFILYYFCVVVYLIVLNIRMGSKQDLGKWKADDELFLQEARWLPTWISVGKAFSLCVHSSGEMLWNLSFFVGVHNDNNSWLCFTQSQTIC